MGSRTCASARTNDGRSVPGGLDDDDDDDGGVYWRPCIRVSGVREEAVLLFSIFVNRKRTLVLWSVFLKFTTITARPNRGGEPKE